MAVEIKTINIKCVDPGLVARFWLDLLGYEVIPNHTTSIQAADPSGHGPEILFAPWNKDDIPARSRMHFDIRPDDQDYEVERAVSLGGRQVEDARDAGKSWVVMHDPEGNAFCILASRHTSSTTFHALAPAARRPVDRRAGRIPMASRSRQGCSNRNRRRTGARASGPDQCGRWA